MPIFTVAIPFYNDQNYLSKAITSCLHQEFQESFEILLINDGSSDASLKIAKNFRNCFPEKIRLINLKENKGVGFVRQRAVEAAKGDYIVWADADDVQCPQRLKTIRRFFKENPDVDICLHDCYFIDKEGRPIDKQLKWPKSFEENPLYFEIKRNYFFIGFSAQRAGLNIPFRSRCRDFPEDYDFILRALFKNKKLKLIPEKLSHYRIHGKNRSNRHSYTYRATKEILEGLNLSELSKMLQNSSCLKEKEISLAICELLMTKENFKEALEKLKNGNHNCFYSNFMQGVCYFFLGNNKDSALYFDRAYSLDSTEPSVQNNLGVLKYKMGEVESAVELLKNALQNKPDYLDAQRNLKVASNGRNSLSITKKPLRLSWVY
ncbi:Uncharacterized protein AB751O23_AD_00120 [Chlamydiales bacterium SCGC AB-751-O23]|jgi:glycosyltransferase involved in cell wall biosynthesis|nr:Uncharacterized protein AB751O23_AD_00120 [Chlamydiales bacterium SCGC AB-751-O23]